MSLYGECDDCGRGAQLHFKPDALEEQKRPSVCYECKLRREELMRDATRREYDPRRFD